MMGRVRLLLALGALLTVGPPAGAVPLFVTPFDDGANGDQGRAAATAVLTTLQKNAFFLVPAGAQIDQLLRENQLPTANPGLFGRDDAPRRLAGFGAGLAVVGKLARSDEGYRLATEVIDLGGKCVVRQSRVVQVGADLPALAENVAGTLFARLTGAANVAAELEDRKVRNDNSAVKLAVRFNKDLNRQAAGFLPTFYRGDLVRMKVTASEPGYFLVIDVGTDSVSQLYPPCDKFKVEPTDTLDLPTAQYATCGMSVEGFECFGDNPGIEHVHVFFSKQPFPERIGDPRLEPNTVVYTPSSYRDVDGSFLARLRAALTGRDPQWNGTSAKYYYGVSTAEAMAEYQPPAPEVAPAPVAPDANVAAANDRGKEIIVDSVVGYCELAGHQARDADDLALLDARRNAVEQAVGVMLTSETEVSKFRLVKDRINVKTQNGYVRIINVLERSDRDGVHMVRIAAAVSPTPLVETLHRDEQLRGVYDDLARPRLVLMVDEEAAGQKSATPVSETQLAGDFGSSGLMVYDSKQLEALGKRDEVTQALLGNEQAKDWLRNELKTELVIRGSASAVVGTRVFDPNPQVKAVTELNLQILSTADGRVLTTFPSYGQSKLEPSGNDPQADALACRHALADAVAKAMRPSTDTPGLLDRLLATWMTQPTLVTLRLSKAPRAKVTDLVKALRPKETTLREVTIDMKDPARKVHVEPSLIDRVELRNFSPAVSLVEVFTPLRGDRAIDHLAERLEQLGWEITAQAATRLDAGLKQG